MFLKGDQTGKIVSQPCFQRWTNQETLFPSSCFSKAHKEGNIVSQPFFLRAANQFLCFQEPWFSSNAFSEADQTRIRFFPLSFSEGNQIEKNLFHSLFLQISWSPRSKWRLLRAILADYGHAHYICPVILLLHQSTTHDTGLDGR